MNFNVFTKYKGLFIWSILFLVFTGAFTRADHDNEIRFQDRFKIGSGTVRLNFHNAQKILGAEELSQFNPITVDNKWIKIRKKYKRLIEGYDDHEIYAKTIQYFVFVPRALNLNYESPFFISPQQRFIFRLTVF